MTQIDSLEKLLKKYNQKLSAVLYLSVNKDIVTKRIMGRITLHKCSTKYLMSILIHRIVITTNMQKYFQKRTDDNLKLFSVDLKHILRNKASIRFLQEK